jgi:hypothetical protein
MRLKFLVAAMVSASLPPIFVLSAAACNHRIIVPGSGGSASTGTGGSTGSLLTTSTMGADAGKDAFEEYMDPPCPTHPPPVLDFKCDPYMQVPNCPADDPKGCCMPGQGCYIFVDYPADPCAAETYGAQCIPAGNGGQGAPCMGPEACVAGASCVITGSGDQCVMLCPLIGPSNCPDGTVCEPIDVSGYGGCL